MAQAKSSMGGFTAEAQLRYIGRSGRFKTTASLAVRQPSHLRCDVHGPHQGVLWALTTDGHHLNMLNLQEGVVYQGTSTALTADAWFGLLPLPHWVDLLLGDVVIPATATLHSLTANNIVQITWPVGARILQADINAKTCYLSKLYVRQQQTLIAQIDIVQRDALGLPERLHVMLPTLHHTVDIRLQDVVRQTSLPDTWFDLHLPANYPSKPLPTNQDLH